MTCFFDAAHGPGRQEIMWSPQWGAPRPVFACPACAQRWSEHLQGRDGYPQYGGYPEQRHGYGTGSVVAAGAAGFVGGMIVNEMFDNDDHVDVVDVVDDYGDYGSDW